MKLQILIIQVTEYRQEKDNIEVLIRMYEDVISPDSITINNSRLLHKLFNKFKIHKCNLNLI